MTPQRKGARRKVGAGQPSAAAQVRTYLTAQPPATRRALRKMRELVRAAAPSAVEAFSYGIPGFRLEGNPLVWYAGWKRHVSLYPITGAIRDAYAAALAGYETSKGTVRFPLEEPLPEALVKRLVKARVAEVRGERRRSSRSAIPILLAAVCLAAG